MERGFAGVVAAALLGCAVILAIAFQISAGLAAEAAAREGAAGVVPRTEEASSGGADRMDRPGATEQSAIAPWDSAVMWESGAAVTEEDAPGVTKLGEPEISRSGGAASAASEARTTPTAHQSSSSPPAEINPAEGHTVSPRMADEMGERARTEIRLKDKPPEPTQMTANAPVASSAPAAPALIPGVTQGQTPPAIEMIRGTRRSSEPVAATEDKD